MWRAKRRAFVVQRCNAKQRGILWAFTFEEWCQWWEQQLGPDWFSKRGRQRGQYCMARIGDKGIYRWGNVHCILHDQNAHDKKANGTSSPGERHGNHKLTEQDVLEIRQIKSTPAVIAELYSISISQVRAIKARRWWKHLPGSIVPLIDGRKLGVRWW